MSIYSFAVTDMIDSYIEFIAYMYLAIWSALGWSNSVYMLSFSKSDTKSSMMSMLNTLIHNYTHD